jgi:hypothetical protein
VSTKKKWKFFRAGTVAQVVLSDAADLDALPSLDKKLWLALACPTRGLELDERALDLVDTDRDGRIRPPEIVAAVAFCRDALRDMNDLFSASDAAPLASFRTDTELGRAVHAAASRILRDTGRAEATSISLAEVTEAQRTFVERALNGDGVVPPDSADDVETRAAIVDAIAAVGAVPDRSGKPGIDRAHFDAFVTRLSAYASWLEGEHAASPLGERTAPAARAVSAVRAKIDDYFVRCRLAAFDGRAAADLNGTGEQLTALAKRVLAPEDDDVASLPIARVEAGRPLSLGAVNPAWADRIAALVRDAIVPILGDPGDVLSDSNWALLKERVAAYDAWMAMRPDDGALAALGRDRILELARGGARASVEALIARDEALSGEGAQMESVEKVLRLRRTLVPLLRNFVNFADFYGQRRGAFQIGTLYIDARACELCLPVHDVARHATLAGLSNAFLVYCDCARAKDAEKRTIVAAVTAGDVDNLMVGRNGVFYDRRGDDWDATVTKVVDNPIGVRQAFWAPYKRFVRLVQEQVAKRAAAADADSNKFLEDSAGTAVAGAPPEKKVEAKEAEPKKFDVGTIAAIGVAVGGIATFFSSVVATVLGLGMWMPLGILALALAISGPSMLIAWLKLRQRNIGPLLDANGWAVNAFARVNIPFGAALTSVAALPIGASLTRHDPFAERRRPWEVYAVGTLAVLALGLWYFGEFDEFLPMQARAGELLRHGAAMSVSPR